MPRVAIPLTDAKIKNAKPSDKEYNLADGKGLMLRVKPNGTKLWIFNYYRPYTQKRAVISFGAYPDKTLVAARVMRDKAATLLSENIDPQNDRKSESEKKEIELQNTLEYVAAMWMEAKKSSLEPNTAKDHWRSLEVHLFPELGKIPIGHITAQQAIKALSPIEAKGNIETIKRVCGRLNEIMDYATNTGIIHQNPLRSIRKAFGVAKKEHFPTILPEQLPQLMYALSIARIKLSTRCLIEWQLHTMTRPSEAAGARWVEIDFEKAIWTIPEGRMKKRRAHAIPLSPQSLALLKIMQPISGHREFIFTGDRDQRTHVNSQTANMALKRMGFEGLLVAHGLRSLASTTLNEQGFDADIIEAALSHADRNEVRAAYNRTDYLNRRKDLMNWWSSHINNAATGNNSLAATNIIAVNFLKK